LIHRLYKPKTDSRSETIWLTIYADLITNLVLVFLALFGLTVMGDDALSRAIQSMKVGDIEPMKGNLPTFDSLQPILKEEFKSRSDIKISEETGAVRIQFGEDVLFDSGQAILKDSSMNALRSVSQYIKDLPYTVVVEGHTDSQPIQGSSLYRNNWDLSLARSMAVVRALIKIGDLPENKLATAAYGPYKPRASNQTSEGRRINRRVEIALFRDFSSEKK
jgi:chemotaxis protein MotB